MSEEIFKIKPDTIRAKDLFEMAQERLNDIISILPKNRAYKIIEEYYEILVQLSTAIMYADGYKTLSHIKLIEYISRNYGDGISQLHISLMDQLRKFRHGTVYYGRKISDIFLANNEQEIKVLIRKLVLIASKKVAI